MENFKEVARQKIGDLEDMCFEIRQSDKEKRRKNRANTGLGIYIIPSNKQIHEFQEFLNIQEKNGL